MVASIKNCEGMTFTRFWQAYEEMIRKARNGALTTDDFAGTTISLTNPGTIGTNHSMPRLTKGQGAIIGVGAMEYPAQYQGTSERALVDLGVSKIITLTSTYDHRIIQGAESGEFLRRVHQLLLGEDGFYDDIFTSLRLPYEPVRWVEDIPEGEIDKTARVIGLIDTYRTRGHLMADVDPLNYRQRKHEDLDILSHGLTLWDLDREFPVGGFAGKNRMKLRDVLGVLRDSYCRTVGVEYTYILDPTERRWIQERVEIKHEKPPQAVQKYILSKLNAAEAFSRFLSLVQPLAARGRRAAGGIDRDEVGCERPEAGLRRVHDAGDAGVRRLLVGEVAGAALADAAAVDDRHPGLGAQRRRVGVADHDQQLVRGRLAGQDGQRGRDQRGLVQAADSGT